MSKFYRFLFNVWWVGFILWIIYPILKEYKGKFESTLLFLLFVIFLKLVGMDWSNENSNDEIIKELKQLNKNTKNNL